MKISCEKCGTTYDLDQAGVPPGGLTMKCTVCLHSFTVRPPAGSPTGGGGLELDLSGGGGGAIVPPAPPPPPTPTAAGGRYYVQRSSGKVFGPFLEKAIGAMLEQGKLNGSEMISTDGQQWMPMSNVPSLATYAPAAPMGQASAAQPQAGGGMDVTDLPAPRGMVASPQNVVDLPGLPSAQAPAGQGGAVDFSNFDPSGAPIRHHEAPGDNIDLGEVGGALPELVDLPAPTGLDLGGVDLPGPVGTPPGLVDLPGPVSTSPAGAVDLPRPPGAAPGVVDLPAPAGGVDLPGAAPGVVDLPAPAGGVDLPAPAGGVDLPGPVADVSGLPAPSGGIDLPAPSGSDLPGPTGMEYGQVELGDDMMSLDLDDLPMPAESLDLPGVSDGGQLPAGTIDLPSPVGDGMRSDGLSPKDRQGPGAPHVDVVAPKPPGGDDEIVRFGKPSGAAADAYVDRPPDGVVLTHDDSDLADLDRKPRSRGKMPMMIGVGVLVFLLVAGMAMGFLTDYGFFGLNLITGKSSTLGKARANLATGLAELRKDSYLGYRTSTDAFASAAKALPDDQDAKALEAQALAARAVRYGPNIQWVGLAQSAISALSEISEPELELKKARGLFNLADGKIPDAVKALQATSDAEPTDPEAAIYLGWAQVAAKQIAAARAAFKRALAANAKLPAALFAMAKLDVQQKKLALALERVNKGLALSPLHGGLLLLHGKLTVAKNVAVARPSWKKVANARGTMSQEEKADANVCLGELSAKEGQIDQARLRYYAALKIDPRHADAHLGLGNLAFNAGQFKTARRHFNAAQKPGDLRAPVMIARTLLALHRAKEARAVLQKLAPSAPKNAEIRFLLGRAEESTDIKLATAHYAAAIKLNPKYFEPFQQLARVYLKQKRIADAFATLKQAGQAMPQSPLVRNAIGETHYAIKAFDKAKKAFEETLILDPKQNVALFNLANTLREQNLIPEALAKYEELEKRDKTFPGLSANLGLLYLKLKRYDQAAKAYEQAVVVETPGPDIRLAAAKAFNMAGKFRASLKQAEKVLREYPTRAEARALRAEAHLGLNHLGDAQVEIRQAIQREKRASFFEIEARIFTALRRIADATDSYRRAIKLDPSRVDLRLRRAKLLVRGGAVKEGLKEISAVVKEKPELGEAYLYMGMAQKDLGKEKEAMRSYAQAIKRDPALGEAHWLIGQVHSDNNRLGAALKSFERAVRYAQPTARWRVEALFMLGSTAFKRHKRAMAKSALLTYWKLSRSNDPSRVEARKMLQRLGADPVKKED